jgi:voltage-gated potassium channel
MEFTIIFLHAFFKGIVFVAPLLLSIALVITLLGQIVGRRESWNRFDALYWAFITATTVGYGDIRPMSRLSKGLSVIIALVGMIFTGIMVALAVNSVSVAYDILKPDL